MKTKLFQAMALLIFVFGLTSLVLYKSGKIGPSSEKDDYIPADVQLSAPGASSSGNFENTPVKTDSIPPQSVNEIQPNSTEKLLPSANQQKPTEQQKTQRRRKPEILPSSKSAVFELPPNLPELNDSSKK